MVHEKARDTLPGILQIGKKIVISNVQSIEEPDPCDDANSGTDLESSVCVEKVELFYLENLFCVFL